MYFIVLPMVFTNIIDGVFWWAYTWLIYAYIVRHYSSLITLCLCTFPELLKHRELCSLELQAKLVEQTGI
jgi:hypothetical protein